DDQPEEQVEQNAERQAGQRQGDKGCPHPPTAYAQVTAYATAYAAKYAVKHITRQTISLHSVPQVDSLLTRGHYTLLLISCNFWIFRVMIRVMICWVSSICPIVDLAYCGLRPDYVLFITI